MPSSGEREERLLPCPFCGNAFPRQIIRRETEVGWRIHCENGCGAETAQGPGLERAAALWNARAPAWLPISEAPRDGTEILGGTVGSGNIEFYRWHDEESLWLSRGDYYQPTKALTHWQPLVPPLPLPPEEK